MKSDKYKGKGLSDDFLDGVGGKSERLSNSNIRAYQDLLRSQMGEYRAVRSRDRANIQAQMDETGYDEEWFENN